MLVVPKIKLRCFEVSNKQEIGCVTMDSSVQAPSLFWEQE